MVQDLGRSQKCRGQGGGRNRSDEGTRSVRRRGGAVDPKPEHPKPYTLNSKPHQDTRTYLQSGVFLFPNCIDNSFGGISTFLQCNTLPYR